LPEFNLVTPPQLDLTLIIVTSRISLLKQPVNQTKSVPMLLKAANFWLKRKTLNESSTK
jgi:hypothetical protein